MNFKNKKDAEIFAKNLIQVMDNPEFWEYRVWDNLGWCCSISNGLATIFPHVREGDVRYSCMISDDPRWKGAGSSIWTTVNYEQDPNRALYLELTAAKDKLLELQECINTVKI